ncbi:MAG TPA: AraC family transcriptional regulator [Chthoniobacterales bacterium]|nr:AraC family transcriptional regulator [Chthoniobacterales bacterium]
MADATRVHFLNQNETYRIAHPVSGGDDCTSIRFEDRVLFDFSLGDNPSTEESPFPFQLPSIASTPAISLGLHRLRQNLLRRNGPGVLAVEEEAVSLLSEASAIATRQVGGRPGTRRADTRKAHRDLVYASRVVLAKKFREKVTLENLARAVFSSPFHLARVFRRETGITLHTQLNRLRLGRALHEIADGMTDLTRLALDLGFSSHAHFTHAFSRAFGQSPAQIRRQLTSATMAKASTNLEAHGPVSIPGWQA